MFEPEIAEIQNGCQPVERHYGTAELTYLLLVIMVVVVVAAVAAVAAALKLKLLVHDMKAYGGGGEV